MVDEVVVVPYDDSWPLKFELARARLILELGERQLGIEHIGSTAVAGLSAKPVIDLMIGVASMDAAEDCAVRMRADHGWDYPVAFNATIVGRRFLRKMARGVRTHHAHLVVHEGPLWRDYVDFRDKLRADLPLAREYEELKLALAEKYREQRELYTEAKATFVARVLAMPSVQGR